jgi:hypothetical protein
MHSQFGSGAEFLIKKAILLRASLLRLILLSPVRLEICKFSQANSFRLEKMPSHIWVSFS